MILSVGQDYDVVLQRGALAQVGEYLELDRRVLVVTDDGVPEAYAQAVLKACREGVLCTLPQGEKSKSAENWEKLLALMLEHGFSRADAVVAVGGGVVGDLAGFAAACYMRGVTFYNIPTTLLSQVDSSVGGKTAIDFHRVKNAVGAFWPPKKVIIDPDTLKTLDARQIRAGLAEIIKMACTSDRALFEELETTALDPESVTHWIEGALKIKIDVVTQDPREQGLRRVLNFGHTVGHAIESSGNLLHGEAVALGTLVMCSPAVRERLVGVYQKFGLETRLPADLSALKPFLERDKKKEDRAVVTVWVDEIGSFRFVRMTPEEILEKSEAAQ